MSSFERQNYYRRLKDFYEALDKARKTDKNVAEDCAFAARYYNMDIKDYLRAVTRRFYIKNIKRDKEFRLKIANLLSYYVNEFLNQMLFCHTEKPYRLSVGWIEYDKYLGFEYSVWKIDEFYELDEDAEYIEYDSSGYKRARHIERERVNYEKSMRVFLTLDLKELLKMKVCELIDFLKEKILQCDFEELYRQKYFSPRLEAMKKEDERLGR